MKKYKSMTVTLLIALLIAVLVGAHSVYLTNKSALLKPFSSRHGSIVISPESNPATNALIFISGNFMPKQNYINLLNNLAEQQYKVILIQSSYTSSMENVFNTIKQENPEIKNWVVGGHSFGGTLACRMAEKSNEVRLIVLVNSYCNTKLSTPTISIQGRYDKFSDWQTTKTDATYVLPINHTAASGTRRLPFDGISEMNQDNLASEFAKIVIRSQGNLQK